MCRSPRRRAAAVRTCWCRSRFRLLDVVAVDQVGDPVHGTPVRGDEALEAELAAQDSVQRVVVRARVDVVDPVVRTHHGTGAGVDRGLERLQLGLVQRLVADRDAGRRAAVLEVVLGKVLDLGDHALALHALDLRGDELRGKKWVFAERLGITASGDEVDLVHHRREPDVFAGRAAGVAHHLAVPPGRTAVPGRGQSDRRGHRGLDVRKPDPGWPIGETERRDSEPPGTPAISPASPLMLGTGEVADGGSP